jgi:hypothetical protein
MKRVDWSKIGWTVPAATLLVLAFSLLPLWVSAWFLASRWGLYIPELVLKICPGSQWGLLHRAWQDEAAFVGAH